MKIETTTELGMTVIRVTGIVKSVEDSLRLKETISTSISNNPSHPLTIDFVDTFIIPSSVIGSLLKFIQLDKARISVIVRQPELLELLDNLKLTTLMNVIDKTH
ncbi:MAG: hypothetical protein K6347_04520 [Campylobacterales bacterium]